MKKKIFKILIIILLLCISGGGIAAYLVYNRIFAPNILVGTNQPEYLLIPRNSNFETLKDSLYAHDWVSNKKSFEWVADKKGLSEKVRSGRFEIMPNMSNNTLTGLLRSGKQAPVNLTFNNLRTKELLAGRIAQELDFDSTSLMTLLNDSAFLAQYNKNPQTALSLFIPNTYQIYWNITPEDFVERMNSEYDAFWNEKRRSQAQSIGLSIDQVMVLASIVQEETNKNDEKRRIAGVYMNRLKSNWPLQADPTLKFALGDFTIRRILNEYKEVNSPYNTYKYIGLPPGQICMPDISSIDAVLDYEQNNYYYFCAKDDMSGYHVFATSLAQHNINAKKYWNALNRARIYR